MSLFGEEKVYTEKEVESIREDYRDRLRDLDRSLEDDRRDGIRAVKDLEATALIAKKEADFQLSHVVDERVKTADTARIEAEKTAAVLEAKNEMLGTVTDIAAEIFDVKTLVSQLIAKLPEININSLSLMGGASSSKKDESNKSNGQAKA